MNKKFVYQVGNNKKVMQVDVIQQRSSKPNPLLQSS